MKGTAFTLKARDFIKGAIMAVLVPVVVIIQQSLDMGELVFNWQSIGMAAVGGFVGYLIKNFATDDIATAQKRLYKARENQPKI